MTQSDCDPTLSSVAFEGLRDMLYRESGIVISSSKSSLMVSRLNRRLRHLGLTDFDRYLLALEQDETGQERREFIAAMTTNVTSFFREGHHFKQLARDILPPLIARAKSQDARLRIWSAGCSTGEEAYSIAITLLDLLPDAARYDIKILATDIDTHAIGKARAGRYRAGLTKGLSADQISRYFQEEHHQGEPWLNIRAEPRHLIAFEPLNLHGPWPMRGPMTLWRTHAQWDIPDDIRNGWIAQAGRAIAHATHAAISVIDFPVIRIDGWMPSPIRAALVARVEAELAGLDFTGLERPVVQEGTVGADARALGAASQPLFRRFLTGLTR
jgi:chemotaxis protein methyltransferase CheR